MAAFFILLCLRETQAAGILEFLYPEHDNQGAAVTFHEPTTLLEKKKPELGISFRTEDVLQIQQEGRDTWRLWNQTRKQFILIPLKERFAVYYGKSNNSSQFLAWLNKEGALSSLVYSGQGDEFALAWKIHPKFRVGYAHRSTAGSGGGCADFSSSFTDFFGGPQNMRVQETTGWDLFEAAWEIHPKINLRAQEKTNSFSLGLDLQKSNRRASIPFRNQGGSWNAAIRYSFEATQSLEAGWKFGQGQGDGIFSYNLSPLGTTQTKTNFTESNISFSKSNRSGNSMLLLGARHYNAKANLELNAFLEPITGNLGHFGDFLLENSVSSWSYDVQVSRELKSHWNLAVNLQHQELEYRAKLNTAYKFFWGALPTVYEEQNIIYSRGQIEMGGLSLCYRNKNFRVNYLFTQYLPHDFKDLRSQDAAGGGSGGGGGDIIRASPLSTTRGGNLQSFTFNWEF